VLFHILRPVQMHVDGRDMPLPTIKVRGLLAILLLTPNTLVATDTIVSRLWDDDHVTHRPARGRTYPPDRRKTLQIHVARLRKAFKNAGIAAQVINDQHAYRLVVDPADVDYHRFRRLTVAARRAAQDDDHLRAVTLFGEAVGLWHGEPFAELTTSWAQHRRDTLVTQDLLPAYQRLVNAHLALGQYERAIERLEPLIAEHSVDEALATQWMRARAAIDGPASLSGYVRGFVERYRKDMEAEPAEVIAQYARLTRTGGGSAVVIGPTPPPQPPDQLPRSAPYFVGRRDTLAVLDELLLATTSSAPVVAIDGPPGIGKTALVMEWANKHRDRFPDGRLFVNLSGHGPSDAVSAMTVLTSFLVALNVPADRQPPGLADRAALLRTSLGNRRVLIVLDNALDSQHVRPILAAAPAASVVVTSRQQLTGLVLHEGGTRITVDRLRPHESIALLVDRLGPAQARPDSPALRDLAEICDGMPLGLNIAAQYVATMPNVPLKDLVETLRQQPPVLLDAGIHGDAGANSLRVVFSWSYARLGPDARTIFTMLGLHSTAYVSVGAAAALAGVSVADAARTLDHLQGAHLVDQQSLGRFRLHDLIFVFASTLAADLAAGSRQAAIHRMADWYLATMTNAVRTISPDRREVPPLAVRTTIVPDTFEDAERALRWCVDQRTNLLAAARLTAEAGFHDHTWRLVARVNSVLNRYGDPRDLMEIHQVGLASARACGSPEGEAGMLNSVAMRHLQLAQYELAQRYFDEAHTLFGRIGDSYGETISLMNIATTHVARGRFQTALGLYEHVIAMFDQIGDVLGRARARQRLGDTYRRLGRTTTAAHFYRAALALWEDAGNNEGRADVLGALGELHLEMGEPATAITFCENAIGLHAHLVDERRKADAYQVLAAACLSVQRAPDAVTSATRAVECYAATGGRLKRAESLDLLGKAHAATGDAAAARAAWTEAVQAYDELDDPAGDDVQREIDGLDLTPPVAQDRTRPLRGTLLPWQLDIT
jgi:DNA-binding SARP family transcriptional activator/predicted negative regulator of RcsB-dependent stress response